jgi:hypothetical protein
VIECLRAFGGTEDPLMLIPVPYVLAKCTQLVYVVQHILRARKNAIVFSCMLTIRMDRLEALRSATIWDIELSSSEGLSAAGAQEAASSRLPDPFRLLAQNPVGPFSWTAEVTDSMRLAIPGD